MWTTFCGFDHIDFEFLYTGVHPKDATVGCVLGGPSSMGIETLYGQQHDAKNCAPYLDMGAVSHHQWPVSKSFSLLNALSRN
jgi:hypothetical protein